MKCPYCNGEYVIETKCTSSDFVFDKENEEWVSSQGFVERTKCCQRELGEGYGDANYFKTREEAEADAKAWKEKIGQWF